MNARIIGRFLKYTVLFQVCLHGNEAQTTFSKEAELRDLLRTNYSSEVRPNSPTEVHVVYSLRSLLSLDISRETLGTTGWITLIWNDPRLVWNASDYMNIYGLDINWAWAPTFTVTNVIEDFTFYGGLTTVLRVHSDGSIRWDVPLLLTTGCSVDITLFPFDSQTCYIEGIFWRSSTQEISLTVDEHEVYVGSYIPNGEWDLLDASSGVDGYIPLCCPLDYTPVFNYSLAFKRKRPYYVTNLLLPTLMMSVCIVWTFILPIESGERIGYSITIMLTYTVLLTLTSGFLPTTSTQTPFIAAFIIIILVFSLGAVALTVLNVKLFNIEGYPPALVQTIFSYLGYLLFCQCRCRTPSLDKVSPIPVDLHTVMQADHDFVGEKVACPMDSRSDVDGDPPEPMQEITWRQLSEILDRFFFFMYVLAIAIFDIVLLAALNGAPIPAF